MCFALTPEPHASFFHVFRSRWVDETANLPVAPGPSPIASRVTPEQPWGMFGTTEMSSHTLANTGNTLAASAIHSPGWPSPRAERDESMQPPLPSESTKYHGTPSTSAGPAVAMPPTPPEMLSRSTGRGSGGVWQSQARASGEAVGVSWLGVAETATASTNQAGGAAAAPAAAAAAAGENKREVLKRFRMRLSQQVVRHQ